MRGDYQGGAHACHQKKDRAAAGEDYLTLTKDKGYLPRRANACHQKRWGSRTKP